MLEEGLNLVGYSAIVSFVTPGFSNDNHAFMFRDRLTL